MALLEIKFWTVVCDAENCSMDLGDFDTEVEALKAITEHAWKWHENKIFCLDCWMEHLRPRKSFSETRR